MACSTSRYFSTITAATITRTKANANNAQLLTEQRNFSNTMAICDTSDHIRRLSSAAFSSTVNASVQQFFNDLL